MVGKDTSGAIPSSLGHYAKTLIAQCAPPDGVITAHLAFGCIIDLNNTRKMITHLLQCLTKTR